MRARREGFTLIELLIVLVLVAILATIGLSRFWQAKDRGLLATMKSDLRSLAVQQESYFGNNFSYAADIASLDSYFPSPGVLLTINYAGSDGWAVLASHGSVTDSQVCAYFYGEVPSGAGAPATDPGVVNCQ
jgi:prepilin-type N-terminal cleavage/methylation domain-containing protein